jgi:hypothetical protein
VPSLYAGGLFSSGVDVGGCADWSALMAVTFYVYDPARIAELEKIIDAMEAEDPLEEEEGSAYDLFGEELEAHQLEAIPLDEQASSPAEAFYEFFHDRVGPALDKLYLTPTEATSALASLEKQAVKKGGMNAVAQSFRNPNDDFSPEEALVYLETFLQALRRSIELRGLMAICYR